MKKKNWMIHISVKKIAHIQYTGNKNINIKRKYFSFINIIFLINVRPKIKIKTYRETLQSDDLQITNRQFYIFRNLSEKCSIVNSF